MSTMAPSFAEPVRKTEILAEGKTVPNLQLRYGFNGSWVIDTKNVMWRDTSHSHYLVTLSEECKQLANRRPFDFFPSDPTRVFASRSYQVRPMAGERCDVEKIERLDDARAVALRERALRRAW
jgi:hypothetical protein